MEVDLNITGLRVCSGDRLPAWSPDGSRIAFYRCVGGDEDGCPLSVMVVNADGSRLRQVAVPDECVDAASRGLDAPRWSPDGTKLLLSCGGAIALVRVSGSRPRSPYVSAPPPGDVDISPAWSADGTKIAFIREHPSYFGIPDAWCCQLWVADSDGSEPLLIGGGPSSNGQLGNPSWSPSGQLAYGRSDGNAVWLADADGSNARMTFASPTEVSGVVGWTPDGSMLFVRTYGGRYAVWVVASDGSSAHLALTGVEYSLSISRDGTRIAFERSARGSDSIRLGRLDRPNQPSRRLAPGPSRYVIPQQASPSLSPDGREVAYASDGNCPGLLGIYTVAAAGGPPRRLTESCRPSQHTP